MYSSNNNILQSGYPLQRQEQYRQEGIQQQQQPQQQHIMHGAPQYQQHYDGYRPSISNWYTSTIFCKPSTTDQSKTNKVSNPFHMFGGSSMAGNSL